MILACIAKQNNYSILYIPEKEAIRGLSVYGTIRYFLCRNQLGHILSIY